MAMAMSQAWGKKIGSWADESEAADADSGAAAVAPPEDGFPSLSQATKPSNSKKKSKGQTLSLAEFATGKYIGPGAKRSSAASSGIFMSNDRLTSEELMFLPTGPKERSAEELNEQRLGGGFRGYGGNFRNDRNDRDSNSSNMRFSREREPPMSIPPPASRADESSDWKTARSEFSRGGNEFGGRGGSEFSRGSSDRRFIGDRDAPSKADEADSWTSGKKLDRRFEPDDQRYDNSRSYSENTWGGRGRPMRTDSDRSHESERWSEGGLDRKFEEPPQRRRLNLQPRSVPVDSASPGQNASSRPSSSHSSRPGTPADVQAQADAAKPRSNPFGSAKPREMVLEERGQDWKKIDSELEHKRYETEEEKMLKHEINSLTNLDNTTAEEVKLQIEQKQQELEQLIKDLDSKSRVSGDPLRRRPPSSHENWNNRPPSSHENWINNSSRPPSSHENRRPPSSHESRSSSRAEVWRRPRTPSMHENEGGWRRDRPRTASGEFGGGFNRPRTPSEEFWRRDNSDRSAFNHNMMFNNGNNEPADMWSRPRTPSVHEDEFFGGHNTNRRFNNNDFHHKPSARW